MGRHSAGDADLDDGLEEVAEPSTGDESGGRHARTGEDDADDRAAVETAEAEAGKAEAGEADADTADADTADAGEAEVGAAGSGVAEPHTRLGGKVAAEQTDLIAELSGEAQTDSPDMAPPADMAPPGKAVAPPSSGPIAPRAPSGTRGDLRLLRQNPALRVRCIGGVVATFLIYTVTLIVIGRTDVYLLWVWIPTVLSGILVGSFLDAAHRRIARTADPPDDVATS